MPTSEADWRAVEPAVRRLAAALFDDPRLRPAPPVDAYVREVREIALRQEGESMWLVVGHFVARGLQLYDSMLRSMLRIRVWSDAEVDDILQGAALRATERCGELVHNPRPLFGWLCTLVKQQRVDWLRAKMAVKRDAGRTEPLDAPAVIDTGTTPTQNERRSRVREMFEDVLRELPSESREVLRLTVDEHLSPADIAERLGLSDENARIRLFRARKQASLEWTRLFPGAAADLAGLGFLKGPPRG